MSVTHEPQAQPQGIRVFALRDGQLAKIVEWSEDRHIGRIVQRYGDSLVTLGRDRDYSWPGLFRGDRSEHGRVEILRDGDVLRVTDNQ